MNSDEGGKVGAWQRLGHANSAMALLADAVSENRINMTGEQERAASSHECQINASGIAMCIYL